jgi:hypothetical protein
MASIAPPAHNRGNHTTDSWITPKWLIDRIGPFDLDPCACIPQPWPCASRQYTIEDNGLLQPWKGLVYCNPPYGKQTAAWLDRMALHGNGIVLVFARTETKMFFNAVWGKCDAILFLRGRLTFHFPDGDGSKAGHNSGGPSVLIAYGAKAVNRLRLCSDLGFFVETKNKNT